jgi:hypothetical protein
MKTSELKEFIRSNGYAWPGGYPCALLMADGECIDAQSARENYRQILRELRDVNNGEQWPNKEWAPVGVFIHWEGESIECAHSGRMIESAYGVSE